jgi:hypothetical protein
MHAADNASAVLMGLSIVNNAKERARSLASQRARHTGHIARAVFAE